MKKMRITAAAMLVASVQGDMDEEKLTDIENYFRELKGRYPKEAAMASLNEHEDPTYLGTSDPWEVFTAGVCPHGVVHREVGEIGSLVLQRMNGIEGIVAQTLLDYQDSANNIIHLFGDCMRKGKCVCGYGGGRSGLGVSFNLNRIAHSEADVRLPGDKAPPRNSRYVDVAVCMSATGSTPAVVDTMSFFQHWVNPERRLLELEEIVVVGIADHKATAFKELCTPGFFLGIQRAQNIQLRALADAEELAMVLLMDALICAGGQEVGINHRLFHEDGTASGTSGPHHQWATDDRDR